MMATGSPWQLTDQERRQAYSALVAMASSLLGPAGPLVTWGFDYLYNRRDLIFNPGGAPMQAIASDGSALRLAALSQPAARPQATLAINTTVDQSARRLGLRNGDPVSMLVTGHTFVGARSGLVVPARIGEQAKVTVPAGSYSVTALGSRQASLFSTKDPYQAAAGNTTLVSGNRQLALSLAARTPLLGTSLRAPVQGISLNGAQASRNALLATQRRCLYCGQTPTTASMLAHMLSCPSRPKPPSLSELPFYCDRCWARFRTSNERDAHFAATHPLVNWWRSL
jgi:hypothetical protein